MTLRLGRQLLPLLFKGKQFRYNEIQATVCIIGIAPAARVLCAATIKYRNRQRPLKSEGAFSVFKPLFDLQ